MNGSQIRATFPAVLIVAGLIALLSWIATGAIGEGLFLGLIVFLILGAIFPLFAVAFGAVVIVYLFYVQGPKLFQFITNLVSSKSYNQPADQPLSPLGPSVPGFTYSNGTTGAYSVLGKSVP